MSNENEPERIHPYGRMQYNESALWPSSIRISTLTMQRVQHGGVDLIFDLSFEDSWCCPADSEPGNWNAAWLFVKYRVLETSDTIVYRKPLARPWKTAVLSSDNSDHQWPTGARLHATSDGCGVFVHRAPDNTGRGPIVFERIRLHWLDNDAIRFPVEVWVHAIEMVYVPQGAFDLGDPDGMTGAPGCFFNCNWHPESGAGMNRAYRVTSENEVPVYNEFVPMNNDTAQLGWEPSGQNGSYANIPASFPKGFNAFYCMRRQITQGEYADFINSLSGDAVTARFPYGGQGGYRFTLYKLANGLRAATRPRRACNWLGWLDGAAFAWWAGLRPMTEFEYEKACRGTAPALSNEFAWGTTFVDKASIILGEEAINSMVTGNCNIDNAYYLFNGGDGGIGPVRDDDFLVRNTTLAEGLYPGGKKYFHDKDSVDFRKIREATGSSFYGIMGLSGNLWEYVVSAGNDAGRSFRGLHGTGNTTPIGLPEFEHNSWPGMTAFGMGYRGGSWYTDRTSGIVANRCYATGLQNFVYRSHDTGMRCVRTVP